MLSAGAGHSCPTMHRRTTTWASRWLHWIGWRRRLSAFASALERGAGADTDRLADVYASLGEALVGLGRYDDALAACRAMHDSARGGGVERKPGSAAARPLRRGMAKYEGRWFVADHDPPRADARVPDLAEVAGKRVLLTCEQGHGDMIQFARYAPLLGRHGARVTLQTYVELKALMQTLDGVETVIASEETGAAGRHRHAAAQPASGVRHRARQRSGRCAVSACAARPGWKSGSGDWDRARGRASAWPGGDRSIFPSGRCRSKRCCPCCRCQASRCTRCRTEFPPAQRDWLATHPLVIDHRDELRDYADTAALISLLDLVITIDTSVAHLAGALGKPVWIMLPYSADWRWLLESRRQPLVSDGASVPSAPTRRLGRRCRRCGEGTRCVVGR